MLNAKKGLSACQAARDLEMRRPTVQSMMRRVRTAMGRDGEGQMLAGLVEMDETFVGGKPRKSTDRDDPPAPRGGSGKMPVVGAVELGRRTGPRAPSFNSLSGGFRDWNLDPAMTAVELRQAVNDSGLSVVEWLRARGLHVAGATRLRQMMSGQRPVSDEIAETVRTG